MPEPSIYRFFKLLAYFDQMVETRTAVRHRVLKAATIKFGRGAIDCLVRDLSTTGAALEVSSQTGIPAKFTLVIPADALHLPCAVVWRTQYRIGVHFD
jgi:hypothetical protein